MTTLTIQNQTLELFAERALYWRERRTLIVTDTHFGKAAFFRAKGVPVPHGTTGTDLERLRRLLDVTQAARLIILGDFIHAKLGRARRTLAAMRRWREAHAGIEIILIRGNHDDHAGDPPRSWRIRCCEGGLSDPPFEFHHEPPHSQPLAPSSQGPETATKKTGNCALGTGPYVLAGHIHPAVTLSDRDGSGLRLPCFSFGPRSALLPAFGSFTGNWTITPSTDDRIFVIGPDAVVEV